MTKDGFIGSVLGIFGALFGGTFLLAGWLASTAFGLSIANYSWLFFLVALVLILLFGKRKDNTEHSLALTVGIGVVFSILLVPAAHTYGVAQLWSAGFTGLVTGLVAGAIGYFVSSDLTRWYKGLLTVLLVVILAIVLIWITGATGAMWWINWAIVILFTVFFAVDFNSIKQAANDPVKRTLGRALHYGLDLYMNLANLTRAILRLRN